MARAVAAKRQYLAREHRRQHLLETAAGLVEANGWGALTMISLADKAKVSRQLVYQHFESIDQLLADTMAHLLQEAYERVRELVRGDPENIDEIMLAAEKLTFDLPPARARALWQMMVAHNSADEATSRMSRRLRHLLTNLWAPTFSRSFALDARKSRGFTWMLMIGFWGLMQLVDDRELSRQEAMELSGWLMTKLRAAAAKK